MSGPAQNIHNIYDPLWEHDACGIGAVVNLKGTPSHATVDSALKIVEKLEHRAGKDAAGETGDGVGLMIQVPHKLMVKAASAEGIALGGPRDYGVGMFFFPADALKRAQAQKMLERPAVDIFFNNAEISRGVYHPAFYFIAWQAEIAKAFDNVIDTDY